MPVMIEEMIEAQWNSMYLTSLPRQRFFTPNEIFWEKLNELKPHFNMIIDCGTGNGELPKEAQVRDIKMAGIDIIHRDGNDLTEVQCVPAHHMPFNDRVWALVCRPSHSGWCGALQSRAINFRAGFIYVGKPNNIDADVDLDCNLPTDFIHDVGEEGESMLVWMPS